VQWNILKTTTFLKFNQTFKILLSVCCPHLREQLSVKILTQNCNFTKKTLNFYLLEQNFQISSFHHSLKIFPVHPEKSVEMHHCIPIELLWVTFFLFVFCTHTMQVPSFPMFTKFFIHHNDQFLLCCTNLCPVEKKSSWGTPPNSVGVHVRLHSNIHTTNI